MSRIGLIVASTRARSNGSQIAAYLASPNTPSPLPALIRSRNKSLHVISLSELSLPPFTEPIIPASIDPPNGYPQAAIRQWSKLIASMDAFIILTPQYNGGYPASIKNALDHLYKEWVGKPTLIISYGARGGGGAAEQLKVVCAGVLKMKVVDKMLGISLPRDVIGGPKTVEDDPTFLKAYRGELKEGVEQLLGLL